MSIYLKTLDNPAGLLWTPNFKLLPDRHRQASNIVGPGQSRAESHENVTPTMANSTKSVLGLEALAKVQLEPEPEEDEPLRQSLPVKELSMNQHIPGHCQPIGSHLRPKISQKSEVSSKPVSLSFAQVVSGKDMFHAFRTTLSKESREKDNENKSCRTRNSSGYSSKSSSCSSQSNSTEGLVYMRSGSQSLKMKTVLCKYYLSGGCSRDSQCNFAHGSDELRQIDYEGNSSNSRPVLTPDQKRRTKLCKNVLNNEVCPYSVNCNFAHSYAELKRHTDGYGTGSSNLIRNNSHGVSYKTQLCTHYERQGQCWLQENCNFAHGLEELRQEGAMKRPISAQPKPESEHLSRPQRDLGQVEDGWVLITKKKGLKRESS